GAARDGGAGVRGGGASACDFAATGAGTPTGAAAARAGAAAAAAFATPLGGGGGGESGRPGASMRMSSAPTASTSPIPPPSLTTVPATGDGISTVALSVITAATTWSSRTRSPTLTDH